jgi:hypothetical protein
MSLAMRPILERAGIAESVRLQALNALRQGNEDARRFLVHSPYRVIEISPQPTRTWVARHDRLTVDSHI